MLAVAEEHDYEHEACIVPADEAAYVEADDATSDQPAAPNASTDVIRSADPNVSGAFHVAVATAAHEEEVEAIDEVEEEIISSTSGIGSDATSQFHTGMPLSLDTGGPLELVEECNSAPIESPGGQNDRGAAGASKAAGQRASQRCEKRGPSKRVPGYSTTLTPNQLSVGQRVRVMWEREPLVTYDGEVIDGREELGSCQKPTVVFRVDYDDGDRRWHRLCDTPVQLLPPRSTGKPSSVATTTLAEKAHRPNEAGGYQLLLSERLPSGYTGVHSNGGGWRARWTAEGKTTSFGTFGTPVEAAVAIAKHLHRAAPVDAPAAAPASASAAVNARGDSTLDDSTPTEAEGYVLKLAPNTKSGYFGVSKASSQHRGSTSTRWYGQFNHGGERVYVGSFGTRVAAAVAVAKALYDIEEADGQVEAEEEDEEPTASKRARTNADETLDDSAERFVEMDGTRLHIYPRVTKLRGRELHLNPMAASGYVGVHWKQQFRAIVCENENGTSRQKMLGCFGTAEEAAFAVAGHRGPISEPLAREADGVQLCLDHTTKLGYLFVKQCQGLVTAPFRAGSTHTYLGHYPSAVEAAVAVAKHLQTLASIDDPRAQCMREKREGGAEADTQEDGDEDEDEEEEEEGEAAHWAPTEGSYRYHILQMLLESARGGAEREDIVSYVQRMQVNTDGRRDIIVNALSKEKRVRVPLWEQVGSKYSLTAQGEALRSNDDVVLHLSYTSSSGFKGVFATGSGSVYRAVYQKRGQKDVSLGRFPTAKEAAICYAKYVRSLPRSGSSGEAESSTSAKATREPTKREMSPASHDEPPTKAPRVAPAASALPVASYPSPSSSVAASTEPRAASKAPAMAQAQMTPTSEAIAISSTAPAVPVAGGGWGLAPKVAVIKQYLGLESCLPPHVAKEANECMGMPRAADAKLPSQVSALLCALGVDEVTLQASGHGLVQKVAAIRDMLALEGTVLPRVISEASECMDMKPAADATLPTQVLALLCALGIDEATLETQKAPVVA